ncbi:MAG: hypothetical protein NTZ38_00715 [Candidatus Taylorbacteria bacterium]|nr:hypothetical protein [Candidatus Taylorbacteria bacterium]
MKYGKQSVWKRFISSKSALFLSVLIFIFMSKALWNIYQKSSTSEFDLNKAKSAYASLQAHEIDVSRKVMYLSSEEGVMSEIRSKFRAVSDDESVAVIVDDRTRLDASGTAQTASVSDISWWGRILRMFGL